MSLYVHRSEIGEKQRKTEEYVDHRQNNNYVKAVGTSPVRSN